MQEADRAEEPLRDHPSRKDPLNLSGARPHSEWAPPPIGGWEVGLLAGALAWIVGRVRRSRKQR